MWSSGDQKAAKCNTGGLGGGMVSVKCGFRLEYFSTLTFLLTNIVATFVFSAIKNNSDNKKKKPNEAGALKGISGLLGQRPHPEYYLNHFE